MNDRPPRVAGGFLLAVLTLAGAGIGIALGQATAGLLAGFAAGVVVAVVVALWDAKRG